MRVWPKGWLAMGVGGLMSVSKPATRLQRQRGQGHAGDGRLKPCALGGGQRGRREGGHTALRWLILQASFNMLRAAPSTAES